MCWTAGYDVGGDGTEPQSRLWDVKEAVFVFFIAEMIYEVITGSWFDAIHSFSARQKYAWADKKCMG